MAEGDTFVNALIGAVVNAIAGALIPFGPVVGGAVAGYLQGGSREDGLKVGALAGAIALVPMFLLLLLFGGLIFAILAGTGAGAGIPFVAGGFGIIAFFVFIFGAVYVIGLSAVGGLLGNYVKYDTDVDI